MSSWQSSKLKALALFSLIAIPLLIAGLKIRNAQYSIEDLLEKDIQGLAEPKTDDSSRPAPRSNVWKPVSFRKVRPRYKGGVISGRIVDPEGYSLPKSSVQLISREAKSGEERTVAAADTDEEGRFRFTGIAPGITLWIAIKAPHYYEHRTDELKSPRTKLELPAIVLEPFGMGAPPILRPHAAFLESLTSCLY